MDEFENMLEAERISVERFVRFRMSSKADADDVLQEVFFTAYQKFPQLKNKDSFKAWIISIARNKCNDYFRKSNSVRNSDRRVDRKGTIRRQAWCFRS